MTLPKELVARLSVFAHREGLTIPAFCCLILEKKVESLEKKDAELARIHEEHTPCEHRNLPQHIHGNGMIIVEKLGPEHRLECPHCRKRWWEKD